MIFFSHAHNGRAARRGAYLRVAAAAAAAQCHSMVALFAPRADHRGRPRRALTAASAGCRVVGSSSDGDTLLPTTINYNGYLSCWNPGKEE